MGFDKKLLNNNEDILLDLRPHWWYVTPQVALVVLAVIVTAVAAALGAPTILLYILGFVVLATLLNLGWRWLTWTSTNFVITTDRLIFRDGVIAKRGIEIPLERINTVFFGQSLFERLVGSGDLTVESASEGGQQNFNNVRRPSLVQQEIYRAMEINKNQEFSAMAQAQSLLMQAAQPADRTLSIPEQIEQLDQLRVRGVITEAEFQTKKADLLNRM